MSEETAPYGTGPAKAQQAVGAPQIKRIRTHHLREMKQRGEKFAMLTAYEQYAAQTFDEAGIEVLLVGDSASNNVFANETSLPVTVDELIPLVRAVTRSARRALVVADLPFGSYQASPEQAYLTAVRFMKEANAHAVKLEGGIEMAPQVRKLTEGGIPVMAHIGFTPQSEHNLGGYRVQGRGDAAKKVVEEAQAMEEAGAFAVVMEMVPSDVAAEVTASVGIPTIGIGAGVQCDGQVLVWQDAFGLRTGRMPRFVKQYADLHGVLLEAAQQYAADVKAGTFPAEEHTF
jgi:3-methyl-2-oxobutanoate hydroxymethyltransferase